MDGFCINLTITVLAFAKACGMVLSPSQLMSLFLMVLLLSVGAPGITGSGIVCIAVLLAHVGLPSGMTNIYLGLYALTDLISTSCNVTGDGIVSTIVAKSENLLNLDVYNKE